MQILRVLVALALLALGAGVLAPAATAYPAGQTPTAAINALEFAPGADVVVTVGQTTPGPLTMQLFSAPATIGTGAVGADGSGTVTGTIPAGYQGSHTIQVYGAGGEIFVFQIQVVFRPPSGSFSAGCFATPGGAGDSGSIVVVFQGFDFPPLTTYVLLVDGVRRASGATSADGGIRLAVRLTITPGTDIALTLTTADGTVVASSRLDDQNPCPVVSTPPTTTTPTTPPTGPPNSPPAGSPTGSPTPVGSGTTVTVGVTLPGSGDGGGSGGGDGHDGDLASTGVQVGVGAAVGLAALLAGASVLVGSRRRPAPRHGA